MFNPAVLHTVHCYSEWFEGLFAWLKALGSYISSRKFYLVHFLGKKQTFQSLYVGYAPDLFFCQKTAFQMYWGKKRTSLNKIHPFQTLNSSFVCLSEGAVKESFLFEGLWDIMIEPHKLPLLCSSDYSKCIRTPDLLNFTHYEKIRQKHRKHFLTEDLMILLHLPVLSRKLKWQKMFVLIPSLGYDESQAGKLKLNQDYIECFSKRDDSS